MKYHNFAKRPETDYCWVYGNLLKNIEREKFYRIIAFLEAINEDAEYSVSVMGHRAQYLWVMIQSRCRDFRVREVMARRIHAYFYENNLNGWVVLPQSYRQLN